MKISNHCELTIILAIKDNSSFTRRWLHFMDIQRCPYKIFIADGGSDESIEIK
jgi:hypothetical protein